MRIRKLKTRHVTYAVLAVLVGLVALLATSPLFGVRFDVVLSGSMSPSLNAGDLVVVVPASLDGLKVGDIVVFKSPLGGDQVCHRLIGIEQGSEITFLTKGDNNEDPDPFVLKSQDIVGKVHAGVPFLGYVIQWLRGPFGLLVIIGLLAAALLIPDGRIKGSRKENAKEDMDGGTRN